MTDLRLRPRFRLVSPCDAGALLEALKRRLSSPGIAVRGVVYHSSCVLKVPEEAAHYWSPQLHVSIDPAGLESESTRTDEVPAGAETGPGHTVVHGIYGPRPAVWSMFVALYVAVGFAGTMGVIFGYSQALLGETASAYWAGPIAIVLCLVIYLVARQGRRLGRAQMVLLRSFFDEDVAKCEEAAAGRAAVQ